MKKENVEMANSILWFLMDALWMVEWTKPSMAMAFPTLITGALLVKIERSRDERFVDIAMFMWMVMNVSWLFSEVQENESLLMLSKAAFILGAIFIALALIKSPNRVRVYQKFKRLRI